MKKNPTLASQVSLKFDNQKKTKVTEQDSCLSLLVIVRFASVDIKIELKNEYN